MKHSIRFKMTAILITIIGAVLFFTWILNSTFAETYYISSEKSSIIHAFEETKQYLDDGENLITMNENLEQLSNRTNIKMMVAKTNLLYYDQVVVFSNMRDGTRTYEQIFEYLGQLRSQIMMHSEQFPEQSQNDLSKWLFDNEDDLSTLIHKGYYVTEIEDSGTGQKGLYLFGFTDNDYLVAMRTSIDSILTNVHISSRFMAYMSIITVCIGILVIFIYAYRFTKPIKEMAQVANRMTTLDFDAKVKNVTNDELGELGKSINILSTTLEKTIADLKSANLELQQDIQKKEEIDNMRKEFLSHVSHELKTPIAIIQGYAEGLKEGIIEDPDDMEYYCDVIVDESKKMNEMVHRLLTLNQIEFGNEPLNITRFDLHQLITNKIASSQILLAESQANIIFEEVGPVFVWADEFLIEEVITNYLTNAIHYVTRNGQIRIWFEKRDEVIRIHVFNEGNPIPKEELEKIWIKFYKVDKARTREYGGNGIGLSIVAAIMKAHHREYGVRNEENGVVFYFEL